MQIKEINNKEEWEEFLHNCAEKTFLQSWNWGEFNLAMKNKIWRMGIYNNEKIIGVVLALKILAKRGAFLFIPHGPVILNGLSYKDKKEILELILLHLNNVANQEKASFIRISSLFELNKENQTIFEDLKFRESPMPASSYEATWKLDLFLPEDELLKNMRKTTRYLIKKVAENEDVKIVKSADLKDIDIYQKLNKEVSRRQGFVPFSEELIEKEFEIFLRDGQVLLLFGKHNGETVAGAMIIFWSEIAFYHQAASLGKFSKLSIPYLIQWEAIKEAKKRGCKIYDFWGFTDPEKFPKHPWAGPTLFKMGFGGYKKEYAKTQDFIISNKYWINYIIEKIRKFKRKL
ncbi:MAG: hypothetical protein A2402_00030 [Candidatus Staskawiczbacteria bacterium RIFOXYC1_FULL_37_43]|nr:MAG: hypothetical protein A2813_02675 [Candidatus Staskawiczbacteria bacterium RIFCSPHIGHO2_01_FULL_37_17]OGZ71191.1 MAG: hypothetical protein A2891_00655 [Candidatus Staskawiczbacteria bacterium RIFCSPLOWO2_01_FULL_37_19]OGZ76019.1 MAG: hypothetical protein A2205_03085 [Candidatus Staskawiczbacteria bacterium RIFOXYA1_FULL_37_15]OGZ79988.1 MAG: hypothetical protein A2353_01820 [Candidatus Staskawiczbacteria bacterium RIFOXYB1_FULL_38_37]OGZ81558.1 MAG: hypothetical protein A2325_00030 [Cand